MKKRKWFIWECLAVASSIILFLLESLSENSARKNLDFSIYENYWGYFKFFTIAIGIICFIGTIVQYMNCKNEVKY